MDIAYIDSNLKFYFYSVISSSSYDPITVEVSYWGVEANSPSVLSFTLYPYASVVNGATVPTYELELRRGLGFLQDQQTNYLAFGSSTIYTPQFRISSINGTATTEANYPWTIFFNGAEPNDGFALAHTMDSNGCVELYRSEVKRIGFLLCKNSGYITEFFTNDTPLDVEVVTDSNDNITERTYSTPVELDTYADKQEMPDYSAVLLGMNSDNTYDSCEADAIYMAQITDATIQQMEGYYSLLIVEDPQTDYSCLFAWTNVYGMREALLCTGKIEIKEDMTGRQEYTDLEYYDTTDYKTTRPVTRKTYTVNTGYLTPARVAALIDLLQADSVEFFPNTDDDSESYLVSVTSDLQRDMHPTKPLDFALEVKVLSETSHLHKDVTVQAAEPYEDVEDSDSTQITDQVSKVIENN